MCCLECITKATDTAHDNNIEDEAGHNTLETEHNDCKETRFLEQTYFFPFYTWSIEVFTAVLSNPVLKTLH